MSASAALGGRVANRNTLNTPTAVLSNYAEPVGDRTSGGAWSPRRGG
jgi:hypothetical protein